MSVFDVQTQSIEVEHILDGKPIILLFKPLTVTSQLGLKTLAGSINKLKIEAADRSITGLDYVPDPEKTNLDDATLERLNEFIAPHCYACVYEGKTEPLSLTTGEETPGKSLNIFRFPMLGVLAFAKLVHKYSFEVASIREFFRSRANPSSETV